MKKFYFEIKWPPFKKEMFVFILIILCHFSIITIDAQMGCKNVLKIDKDETNRSKSGVANVKECLLLIDETNNIK